MNLRVKRPWMGWLTLAFALASCASPLAGMNPTGSAVAPAATPSVVPSNPTPAPLATPAPATAPSLPPAPPVAQDARVRLTGVVLFNDAPVTDATLTATDLVTGQPVALTPWGEAPQARRLLSTLRTDSKGVFNLEAPTLTEGQIIKLVATKGSQTFTALFNDKGQAVGGSEATSASYRLQQGTAVSITIRLRLTAGSTAASQAFEGVLRLTFQLPAEKSAERRAAALEAARQAALALEEALAKKPEVAGRLVSSLNSTGEVKNMEAFRTAVTNLGLFRELFKSVQAELRALSLETLTAPANFAPILARQFPLEDVVISPSGFLGFSGQQGPIVLAGQVQSHFVPTPPRGGGGRQAPVELPPARLSFTNRTTSDGLGSNFLFGVYVDGTTVYAATFSGVSISTDGGATFTNRTTGLVNNKVYGVYAVGSTVYAATEGGLSISTDAGASFTNRTTADGLVNNMVKGVYAVGSTVYAATTGGLSISTDAGASFTNRTTADGLGRNIVNGVYAVGSTVYAATTGGLSISTNGGTSFTNLTTADGLGSDIVNGVYAVGSTVYAATGNGLSISTDGGATFTKYTTTDGLGDNSVRGVSVVGSTVYAATELGLSISTDGGATFTNYTTADGLGSNTVQGVYAVGSTVYAATQGGLSISQP